MQALDETECGENNHRPRLQDRRFSAGARRAIALDGGGGSRPPYELYWLTKAMRAHAQIPSTFDDRTPEEAFSPERISPLRIGETYFVPDRDGREVPAS